MFSVLLFRFAVCVRIVGFVGCSRLGFGLPSVVCFIFLFHVLGSCSAF